MRRQPMEGEKILANHIHDNGFYQKYMKNSYNSIMKQNQSSLKIGRRTEKTLSQRRHPNGQQVYEKTLNVTNQQGNAD